MYLLTNLSYTPRPFETGLEEPMAKTSKMVQAKRKPKFGVRKYNRCSLCGRPRAFLRKFEMCRICFRHRALRGEITGVIKSSW